MSDTTATGPRAALAAERERLSNELEAMGVDRASYDEGFADSGQVTAERGEVAALAGSLRDTLNDIEDALRTMKKYAVRRLPVIDGHKLVGIVSQADIAKNAPNEATGDLVEAISAAP